MSVRTKLWTREEFDRLVAAGAFHPESRVQLIQGEIVEMPSQSPAHATTILRLQGAIDALFHEGHVTRAQLPLALGPHSEPEPDIAVVPGALEDHRHRHPATAVLVVEVADTTLDFDRTRKQATYAQASIPEYWIVNLPEGLLEVCRDPQGSTYRTVQRLVPGETIAPLAAPATPLKISDLLP